MEQKKSNIFMPKTEKTDRSTDQIHEMEQELTIKNRQDLNVVVDLERQENPKGLVFVMPGLGGFMAQPNMGVFSKCFKENQYTTVGFDPTNSMGRSGGEYDKATITTNYDDLEDVIEWAKKQDWYQEPFILCGHSVGGYCAAKFASENPEKIKSLALISSVPSGGQLMKDWKNELDDWLDKGEKVSVSTSAFNPDGSPKVKRLEDGFICDAYDNHEPMPDPKQLTMPVLFLAGEKDTLVPMASQKMLYDNIPGENKTFQVLPGVPHTADKPETLEKSREALNAWILSLEDDPSKKRG